MIRQARWRSKKVRRDKLATEDEEIKPAGGEVEEKITEEQAAAEENNADDEEHGEPQIGEGDPKDDEKPDEKPVDGEEEPEPDGEAQGEYTYTGEQAFDEVIDVLSEAKVSRADAESIFGEALKSNDLDKIDTKKLEEVAGSATSKLILGALRQHLDAKKTAATEHAQSIYELAGNKEAWEAAAKWATESKHFGDGAKEINEMLSLGGRNAKAAVDEVISAYKNSSSYTKEAELIDGEDGEAGGATPLNKREYFEALEAENSRSGGARSSALTNIHKAYKAYKSNPTR